MSVFQMVKERPQFITMEQFAEMVHERRGAQVVTIVSETIPTLLTKDSVGNPNPFRDGKGKTAVWLIRKWAIVNGMINWNYANSVNNQRKREGNEEEFEALPRTWGVRRPNSPLVDHVKDGEEKVYLEVKVERSLDHCYVDLNGNEISPELVKPFLPERRESARQETEKEIILRDYEVKRILQIRMNGKVYAVTDAETIRNVA